MYALSPNDLLRNPAYRRLWTAALLSSLGQQVTGLAIPLTAAVLLHATPTQMGWLSAAQLAAFALLSLPVGVWLDRVRKLPVFVAGELVMQPRCSPYRWPRRWVCCGSSSSIL